MGFHADATDHWWRGEVTDTTSRWTDGGRRIVTDVTLRTGSGEQIVVTQPGGHVDGITMRVVHGPARAVRGQHVRMHARPAAGGGWLADRVEIISGAGLVPYVRDTNIHGAPLAWAKRCLVMTTAAEGTTAVDAATAAAAITQARAAWTDGGSACSYMTITDGGSAAGLEPGFDAINLITFFDRDWPHAANAIAVTNLLYVEDPDSPRDGELLDADVDINNAGFRITVDGNGTGTAPCDADLAATLAHELGHALGFDHVCLRPGDPPTVDHLGAPSPFCDDATDPAITEATMFASQTCGETKKATPEADDLAALCAVYPLAADPGACDAPDPVPGGPGDDGGCCDAQRSAGSAPGVAAITLLLLALGARRRRPRHPALT